MDWSSLLWANDLETFLLDRSRLGALGLEFYREGDSRTTDRGRKHIRTTIRGVEVTHPLSADTENVPLLPEPETNTALCAWGHHRPRSQRRPSCISKLRRIHRSSGARRQEATKGQRLLFSDCRASRAAEGEACYVKKRMNVSKQASTGSYDYGTASFTVSAPLPDETAVSSICIASPEGHEGSYFINNELVRWNLTEDQTGVPLIIDFGVIDISTCAPMADTFVEVWSANATGVYSGYPKADPNSITTTFSGSLPSPLTTFSLPPTFNISNFVVPPLQRNETFLRGGMPTNADGIVELHTIYPGYYPDRAPHIHAMFHSEWKMPPNGTIISRSRSNLHTGQMLFPEAWNDVVYALPAYDNRDYIRVRNVDDWVINLLGEAERSSAFFELELLGETVEEGFYACLTVLLDPMRDTPIRNNFYFNSTGYEPPDEEEEG